MLADLIFDFLARHDINAHALLAALAAVVIVAVWGWAAWATVKGIVRW